VIGVFRIPKNSMNFAEEIIESENTELEKLKIMDEATFIIAENNDLCRLGLKCIIHDQIQSPIIHYVSTKIELHSTLLSNSEAVVIIDFDSLEINSIDEVSVLSICFPQSNWLFVADIPDEHFLMPLTASFGKANFVLKTNEYDVIATAILQFPAKSIIVARLCKLSWMGITAKRKASVKKVCLQVRNWN